MARSPLTDEAFREQFQESLKEFAGLESPSQDDVARSVAKRIHYIAGELDSPELYRRLAERLRETGADGVLFDMSVLAAFALALASTQVQDATLDAVVKRFAPARP